MREHLCWRQRSAGSAMLAISLSPTMNTLPVCEVVNGLAAAGAPVGAGTVQTVQLSTDLVQACSNGVHAGHNRW